MIARARIVRALTCLLALVAATPSFALDPTRNIRDFQHTSWSVVDGAPADVWALAQTTDGFLWLGTGSGLFRFDGVRFERFHPTSGPELDKTNIDSLLATSSGSLLVGYRSGTIAILKSGATKIFPRVE